MACVRFGLFSLIAGGLAALVLLPEVAVLKSTASGNMNFPKTLTSYFPIFDMLARHIGNVETETGLDHWPNIYCGVAVFLFFLLYLACKRSLQRKNRLLRPAADLFASFSVNALNFIWHGLHYPNSLPLPPVVYLYFPHAVCLLPGVPVFAGYSQAPCGRGVLGKRLLCDPGGKAGGAGAFPLCCILRGHPLPGGLYGTHIFI